MGDANPIRTLEDYSKPSHEGYRNTIELPAGNNVVPLRSDTIRLVQNGCSFHRLRSEDPNQHLKDFLKLVDSLDLDGENRERTRLRLFQFSLRDQASNWLERLPAGSIATWEDLTTRFLAQFFPLGRTANVTPRPVWGCDRLVIRAKVIENQIMAASAIAISSDSSDESVGSPPSRVILFGDIPTVIPSTSVVAPETSTIAPVISSAAPVVETTLVASPTGLCGLHSVLYGRSRTSLC
ncbi:zinc finger, CCHC-type containing protein [Tanacetum coccineum]|uniref:Zinc finger, CCHC-type containing protein n=1 Tax=Tanacetum coccineum TaxID=301880 RepID=A0ABQ5H1V1_9ASTR